ncbi:MAG: glycosyltransferase [Saprospiraceae bacterium]|nr:glycosyltransferase [Saprospiraceae bacterium]
MKSGIIIPCYNEANRLQFQEFDQFLKDDRDTVLCFVNDGSKDATLELLNQFQQSHLERVHVYDMPQNQGKAEAVRAGINYMLELGTCDNLGFMDADLSTSFEEYLGLVDNLKCESRNLQLVFGSRKGEASSNTERGFFRKLMSTIIGSMIRILLQLPINDTQCGAKVFSLDAARYCFSRPFVSRWLFDVEIFIRMRTRHSRKQVMQILAEIPLKKWVAVGDSKITMSESVKIPAQLLKIAGTYYLKPQFAEGVRAASILFLSLMPFLRS